jgi:hypothetical protein
MLITRLVTCLLTCVLTTPLILSVAALAQQPWQEPQDTAEAINNPDRYAWRLFIAINWPADIKAKQPDQNKSLGAPGPVVWETWRNVNNQAADTVFPSNGSDPGPWLGKETSPEKVISEFDQEPVQQRIIRQTLEHFNSPLPAFEEEAARRGRNETRANRAAYEFIRQNQFYDLDKQTELVIDGRKSIEFPTTAKEIKAQWRQIEDTEQEKSRYHWAKGSDGKIYGLTALHIITKDLPNWFWATFEHVDNKLPANAGGRPGNEGWLLPSRDRFACPNPPYDCNEAPAGLGLQGTVWENYRLRGTQVDFIDSRGNPTHLANSQPESTFQLTASCITCHARATIGKGQRLTMFKCFDQANGNVVGNIGIPNPDWYVDSTGAPKFTQLDFVWSLMRAQSADGKDIQPPDEPSCN